MDSKEQCAEMLAAWDRGDSIWTIEMGGLGPGYEQAIQILAIEMLRDNLNGDLPTEHTWRDWGDSTVARLDAPGKDGKPCMGGFSGAQVGAAKNLAYKWLTQGPEAINAMKDLEDRRIQVSKFWPRVAE